MTFQLEMALDALNGKIDKGIEFPEAIERVLQIFPVSQEELTIAYNNQPALPTPTPQITDYSTLFKQEKDSTLYQLNCNNAMFELVNIPNGSVAGNPPTTVNHHVFTNGRWIPLGNKTIQAAIQWASEQW
jgi:hypothetical protein